MIEVELPDGSVVEFPDGTDENTMNTALADFQPSKPAAPPPDYLMRPPEPDFGKGRMAGIKAMGNELLATGADELATPGKVIAEMVGADPAKARIEFMGFPLTDFAKDQRAEAKYKRGIQQANTPEGLAGFGTELLDSGINMAPSVITTLFTKKGDLGLGVMGAQVFSTEMTASLNEGKPPREAMKDAAIATVNEIGWEKAFGFFDDLPVAKGVKAWLRQIVAETISESATETGTILDERYRQGKDIGTFWDTLLRTGKAGAAGAVMGGGFGAGALIGKNQAPAAAPPDDPVMQMVEAADAAWQARIDAAKDLPPAERTDDVPPPPPNEPQPIDLRQELHDAIDEGRQANEPQPVVDPVQAAKDRIAERLAAQEQTPETVTPAVAEVFSGREPYIPVGGTPIAPQVAPNQVEQGQAPVQERTEAEINEEELAAKIDEQYEGVKRPPDLLAYLAQKRIRLDRTKFGGDLSDYANRQIGTKWLFEGKNSGFSGMGPSELLTFLQENGWMNESDPNKPDTYTDHDAVELLNRALRGERIIHPDDINAELDYQDALRWEAEKGRAAEEGAVEDEWIAGVQAGEALDENISEEEFEAEVEAAFNRQSTQDADAWLEETNVDERSDAESNAARATEQKEGLIPEATQTEKVRAAEQAKTAERNRLGEDEVLPEQGEGELFAGNEPGVRPEQLDIESESEFNFPELTTNMKPKDLPQVINQAGMGGFRAVVEFISKHYLHAVKEMKFQHDGKGTTTIYVKPMKADGSLDRYSTKITIKKGDTQISLGDNITHEEFDNAEGIDVKLSRKDGKAREIVTELSAKRKRVQDAKDRLKAKAGRLNTGVDPEMYKDMLIVGADVIEKGAKNLAEFTKAMVEAVGDWVNEHAERIWNDINQQEKQARTPPQAPQQAKKPYRPSGETSTKNAVTDAERAARDADPIMREARQSNPELIERAEQAMKDNPDLAEETVYRLNNDSDPEISPLSEAVLFILKIDTRREMRRLAEKSSNENLSEDARKVAANLYNDLLIKQHEIDLATYASGRAWGILGQLRSRMMAEDYSFEAQVERFRAKYGKAVPKEILDIIKAQTKEIEQLRNELEEANQKSTDEHDVFHSQATIDEIYRRSKKQGKIPVAKRRKAEIAKLKSEIAANSFSTVGAGIPAGQMARLVRLGGLLIADGANTFAKWTKALKEALGAKIFGHVEGSLKELWEMSLDEHLRIENEFNEDTVETLSAEAKELAKDDKPISHSVVYKLARAFVLSGMTKENEVMAAVHGVLQEYFPDLTEREVRQIFSQYGQATFPSQAADKKTLRELRVLVRLQESINRLIQDNKDPERTGPQRDKATQEIRDKQRALNLLMRQRQKENPLPSREKLATLDEQRITRLKNQIADLEKQLATGEKPVKGEPVPDSDEVKRLKAERDALKQQIKEIEDAQKVQLTEEEKYNLLREKQLKKQLAEVARRLREKDYSKRVRKEPPPLNEANKALRDQLVQAKMKLHEQQADWLRSELPLLRRGTDYVSQSINLSRAAITSIDLSAVLRQGGFKFLADPLLAIKAFVPMIRSLKNNANANAVNEEILSRPNADLYQKAKLHLSEQDSSHPTRMEEVYMGRWASKVPLVAASGRAYVTFLNKLRADSFDAGIRYFSRKGQGLTIEEMRQLAAYINNATGRYDISKAGAAAGQGLSNIFFAPRWMLSRFAMVLGMPMWNASPRMRWYIAQEYLRFALGYSTLFGLGALAFIGNGDDDDYWEWDPRSTDFGKLKMGNTRMDMGAGLAQPIVLINRILSGSKINSKGQIVPIRTDEHGEGIPFGLGSSADVIFQFARSKFAPPLSAFFNWTSGTNVVGESYAERGKFAREVLGFPEWLANNPAFIESVGLMTPLSMRDFYDALEEHGMPKSMILQVFATLGVSMNTYDTESKKSSNKKGRPQRASRPSRQKRPTRN